MTLTGDTREEKKHVTDTMRRINTKLKSHPWRTDQANAVIGMCEHPVLTYGGPLTQWTFQELHDIERSWAVMHKRAWKLTDQHNTAPFLLPMEE
eukprot:2146144-Rhodomonas_salina.1